MSQFSSTYHTAFIGIGANLNEPLHQCVKAIQYIEEIEGVFLVAASSFYKTQPMVLGDTKVEDIPWYVNSVLEIKTTLNALELWKKLFGIELKMGRIRRQKWESRLIDLDLLFYDDAIIQTPHLTLPHPEIENRRFVLEPLCEIAAEKIHPLKKMPVKNLLLHCKDSSSIQIEASPYFIFNSIWDSELIYKSKTSSL